MSVTAAELNRAKPLHSIQGKKLQIGQNGQPFSNRVPLAPECADVDITVSAEGTPGANQRTLTMQFKDANGDDMTVPVIFDLVVFADATLQALATGGSTGIAAGTDGAILQTKVAKLQFLCVTEADGDADFTWTDTGTESVVVGVQLPNGRWVFTDAFANA